jgi:hypothetical protein
MKLRQTLATTRMDAIESLTVYFGDSGEWSANALRDGVWYLRQLGFRSPGYFHRGEWRRATMSATSRRVDLGNPIGLRRFGLFNAPKLLGVSGARPGVRRPRAP